MKQCPKCHLMINEDAVFCSACGYNFEIQKSEQLPSKQQKVKKVKNGKRGKSARSKKPKKQKVEKQIIKQTPAGTKMGIFFLIILVLGLVGVIGVLAYHIYSSELVKVPNVVGMDYDSALILLEDKGFKVSEKQKETTVQDEDNEVLKQSRKSDKYAVKGSRIKLTIGKYIVKYYVEDFIGKDIHYAEGVLKANSIKYEISYENGETDDIIISQSIKNKEILKDEVIKLTVSKKEIENEDNTIIDNTNEIN